MRGPLPRRGLSPAEYAFITLIVGVVGLMGLVVAHGVLGLA